jgi:hypothetical protein
LVRTSRLTARIDNNAIADGFQIYLHSFVVTSNGEWAVVQQGLNGRRTARAIGTRVGGHLSPSHCHRRPASGHDHESSMHSATRTRRASTSPAKIRKTLKPRAVSACRLITKSVSKISISSA